MANCIGILTHFNFYSPPYLSTLYAEAVNSQACCRSPNGHGPLFPRMQVLARTEFLTACL